MMSDFVNETLSNLRRQGLLKAAGPVLESFKYVERFQQKMHVIEFAVANGAQIDNAFGFFVDVENRGNTNESKCTIYFATSFVSGVAVFAERSKKVKPYSEYICSATVRTKIVPLSEEPESGTNIWESTIAPIDDFHALRTTVVVNSLEALTKPEWDESLNVFVNNTRELTQTSADPTVTVVSGQVTHTFYEEIKCGWWLKNVEKFPVINRSYRTNVEFYWPAVLRQVNPMETKVYNRKELPDGRSGGLNAYVDVIFKREAYRGPCAALITEVWNLNPASLPDPQIMLPLPLTYQSPWSAFNVGPTLHPGFTYNTTISDDPEFEDVVITYEFAATVPTDWPVSITASDAQEPVRGGYLRRTVVVYPPTYVA